MRMKMIEYSDGDIGAVKIVKDFLPAPSELVLKGSSVKISLSKSNDSLEVVKRETLR